MFGTSLVTPLRQCVPVAQSSPSCGPHSKSKRELHKPQVSGRAPLTPPDAFNIDHSVERIRAVKIAVDLRVLRRHEVRSYIEPIMDAFDEDMREDLVSKARGNAVRRYSTEHGVPTLESEAEHPSPGVWERRGRSSRRMREREREEPDIPRHSSTPIRFRNVSPVCEIFQLDLTPPTTPPKEFAHASNSPKRTFQYTPPRPVHFPDYSPTEICQFCGRDVWAGALSVHLDACSKRVHLSSVGAHSDIRATGTDTDRYLQTTRRVMHENAEAVVPNNDRGDVRPNRRRSQRAQGRVDDSPPAYPGLSYLNTQATGYWEPHGQWVYHTREHGARSGGEGYGQRHNNINQPTSTGSTSGSPQHLRTHGDGRYFTPPRLPYLP